MTSCGPLSGALCRAPLPGCRAPSLARDLALYAELCRRREDQTGAEAHLRRAIALYDECGADGHRERTTRALSSLLGAATGARNDRELQVAVAGACRNRTYRIPCEVQLVLKFGPHRDTEDLSGTK